MINDKAYFIQYINVSIQAYIHLECTQIPYAFFALRITRLLQTQFHCMQYYLPIQWNF